MIGLLQRVRHARVEIAGEVVGAIGPGLLVFVCAEPGDGSGEAARFVDKVLKLRVFADEAGRMNRSVADTGGGLLLAKSVPPPHAGLQALAAAGWIDGHFPAVAAAAGRITWAARVSPTPPGPPAAAR